MILIAKSLGYISKVSIFVCKLIIMLMNFLELVKARYSARKYAGRSVEIEKLEYIMECVRLAPSAVNFQPWRFKIVTDEPTLKALQQCYKREWLATAPCIIVACTNHEESWHRRADNKDHADIDIAIAVEHLCLAAMALPVWGLYMQKVYKDKSLGYSQEERFNIPEDFDPCKDTLMDNSSSSEDNTGLDAIFE